MMGHEAEFVVDSLLIVITLAVLMHKFSYAGLVLLFNFTVLHVFVYFVLTQLSFWEIFYFDYHLYLAIFGLFVLALIFCVSRDHKVLKFFVSLEALLHVAMIGFGRQYSAGTLSEEAFTVIYDSYSSARILIASFQIIGLIANVDSDHRRDSNVRSSRHPERSHIANRISRRFTSLFRVERA